MSLRRRKNSFTLFERAMSSFLEKLNYFHYTIGEIRKCINEGKGNDKEKSSATGT
jgi:hypothetical protein